MDYEKKYKEALERAKDFMNGEIPYALKRGENIMCWIFPELKEAEDERIRKALIELVKCNERGGYKLLNNVHTSSMLAWLEKQGEQILANSAKTCKDEQKTTDKIEPRFHEGEWVVDNDNNFWKVAGIMNGFYILEYGDEGGIRPSIESADKTFHLWTIQDAKDGDVLASNSSVFIFQEEYIAEKPIAYCGIMNGRFIKGEDVCWTNERYYPATKEQRDTLFAKMHEAGYEWNSEKKELKKIPNALEEREIVHIEHGKCYYCIKDYYAGGNKRASKGDVVMALNGMSMMDLGVKANEYFIPVNNIELKPAEWSEEDEENMNNALYILNQLKATSSYEDDIAEKIIVWLKSLKQRIGG